MKEVWKVVRTVFGKVLDGFGKEGGDGVGGSDCI